MSRIRSPGYLLYIRLAIESIRNPPECHRFHGLRRAKQDGGTGDVGHVPVLAALVPVDLLPAVGPADVPVPAVPLLVGPTEPLLVEFTG